MADQSPQKPSVLNGLIVVLIARPIGWLIGMGLRFCTELVGYVIDEPGRSLWLTVPVLGVLSGVAVTTWGSHQGLWGEPIATAWRSEETARQNLETSKTFLHDQWGKKPRAPEEWEITGHGKAWYDEQKHKRREWEESDKRAKRTLDESAQRLPSAFSMWAPAQDFPPENWLWAHFYDLHHFLFHSIYPWPFWALLAFSIWPAWKGSRRRWSLLWRQAMESHNGEHAVLGLDDAGALYGIDEAERCQHMLVVGMTGSGKTRALLHLIRADIAAGRPVVVIDLKGDRELAAAVGDACTSAGRKDAFFFFTLEPGASHSYNPLASGGNAQAKRDRIISSFIFSKEKFYENKAKAALLRVLQAMERNGGAITFDDLHLALTQKDALAIVAGWTDPRNRPQFEDDLEHFPSFQNDVAGLVDNLAEFSSDGLRERLCALDAQIDLRRAYDGRAVVYFELNSQMRTVAAPAMARLVLEDLKALAGELIGGRGRLGPLHVYIDEAGRAVYDGLQGLIGQCRSAGIGLCLSTQSPLDFETEEAKVMTQILQNTAIKVIFQQPDHESAELCASLGGTYQTTERTVQMVDQGLLLGMGPSGVESQKEVREFVVHPDVIKTLKRGQAFLVKASGARAVIRLPHVADPRSSMLKLEERPHADDSDPPLGLAELVQAAQEKRRGAGAKRSEKSADDEKPSSKDAGGGLKRAKKDPSGGGKK